MSEPLASALPPSPAGEEGVSRLSERALQGLLRDPRVKIHVEDGRQFLQATDERFDLITSEPPPPRAAGVVNLYTKEYFQLIRSRLAPGGMAAYWLPMHAVSGPAARAIIQPPPTTPHNLRNGTDTAATRSGSPTNVSTIH